MSGPAVGMFDRSSGVLHRPGSKHLTPACGAGVGFDGVTVGPLRALWRYQFDVCPQCWPDGLGDLAGSRDGGPLGQVYLNLREVEVVLLALSLLHRLETGMLSDDARMVAEAVIGGREGPGGVARLDQLLERSADDVIVMRSLSTAFSELYYSLGGKSL